jgi:hypothetical protein
MSNDSVRHIRRQNTHTAGGAELEPAARKYVVPKILIIFLIIKSRAQARAHPPGSNTTSLTFHEPNRLEPKPRLESNRLVNITIIYRLVPGHRGVPGNEAADHWAKQGAIVQAASESLKGVWSTTSLSHINRVARGRCQTVTRMRINDAWITTRHTNCADLLFI